MTQSLLPDSPSCKPIALLMDDREPCDLMKLEFEQYGNFDVQIRRLSVGDYRVGEVLLVERKTVTDLVRSIINGRLFGQALRLAEEGLPAVLIIEGDDAELHGNGMSWEAIQGALVTVSLFMGLPVLRSRTPQGRCFMRPSSGVWRRPIRWCGTAAGRSTRRRCSLTLQGLPGMGPKRAKQLIDALS